MNDDIDNGIVLMGRCASKNSSGVYYPPTEIIPMALRIRARRTKP